MLSGILTALTAIGQALQGLFRWFDRRDAIELGKHRQQAKVNEENAALVDRLDSIDPDSVSDTEAFGGRQPDDPGTLP